MRAAALLLLAACGGPQEREQPPFPTQPEKRIVIGGTVPMSAEWASTCTKTDWHWEGGESEHDAPGLPSLEHTKVSYTCNEQPFEVEVKCSMKCELVAAADDMAFRGSASVDVRALELGVMTIDLQLTHTKTAKHRWRRAMVEVVLPDAFSIQCFTPAKRWGPCREGIDVQQPLFRVFPMADGMVQRSSLLRVNGQPAPKGGNFTIGVPLTAFVPTVEAGGIYSIVVSVGTKEQTFRLDAVSAP